MHEFAIYSVIPPEGCAAILWRDSGRKVEAAEALQADGAGPAAASGSSTRSCPSRPAARTRITSWPRRCSTPRSGATLADVSAMDSAARLDARYQKWRADGERGDQMKADRDLGDRLPCDDDAGRARSSRELGVSPVTARLLCIRGLGDLDEARRFLSPSLDDLARSVRAGRHGGRGRSHPRRDRAKRADRHPRRLRRRRRDIHGDSAPRAGTARRRRHALHPRAAARRLRPAAGVARSPARRGRAAGDLGGLRHPRRRGGRARARRSGSI